MGASKGKKMGGRVPAFAFGLGMVQTRDRSPGRDTEMAVPFPVTWGRDKMGTMGTWQDTILEENNPVLL